ncbi:MAG: polysaccharide deacetylase family protein [Chthonomonadales bacterium]
MKAPVLMYHKVGAEKNGRPDKFLNVSTVDFARQMRFLKRLGYTGITYEAVCMGLFQGSPLPKKPVCITFDDGYVNVLENATAVLGDLGWPATIFLPTEYVGRQNRWDIEFGNPQHNIMTWDQLRGLQDKGWEIAGHTHTHLNLGKSDDIVGSQEIVRGRQEIADHLGKLPLTFCYPFGGYNEGTPALVREAGFIGACTTKSGVSKDSTDPMQMPRVKVAYRDRLAGFIYRLMIRPLL